MRKLLSIVLVGLSVSANARQITSDEAMNAASAFMNSNDMLSAKTASSSLQLLKAPVKTTTTSTPYYIFNKGENDGFVIISGDDRAPKILGYSEKGSFDVDNLPPQLRSMMESWAKQMAMLPEIGQHSSWQKSASTRADDGVLLETAEWGQGFPYNGQTPIMEGANCPTGCVATAMAIVMKYHSWPDTYDWASMPKNTEDDPLDYEVFNPTLAGLMADAGESVHMDYHQWESGANMNWVGHKLQQQFKYSPDCQFISSANFPEEKWMTMLFENLDNGYPVIYNGLDEGSTMNHAFVIDGYNSNGFHVNWGWDGLYNGYYVINALTPNEYQDFSYRTGMVLNIVPDKSGTVYSDCFVDNGYFWSTSGFGDPINISVENVVKGEEFIFINNKVTLAAGFIGEIGIALTSADGKIKDILASEEIINEYEERGNECVFMEAKSDVDVDPSDIIQLVTKKKGESEYRIVLGTLEAPSYISAIGNKPKFGNVRFNIGKGIRFIGYTHCVDDRYRFDVPEGNTDLSILRGLSIAYWCTKKEDISEKPIVLKVEGPLLYGTILMSSPELQYGIDVNGDYVVNIEMSDLKEFDIHLDEAGTLKDQIGVSEGKSVGKLSISGYMNAHDFWYIRDNMPCIEVLDLKNVKILECYGNDGNFNMGDELQEANTIPGWALTNLHSSYIKELILPDGLEVIGSDALINLDIKSISIPETVKSIGLNEFYSNRSLQTIELLNPEPIHIEDCVFVETPCPESGTLYVPEGSGEKYRHSPVWQDFKNIIEGRLPEKVSVENITLDIDTCYMGLYRDVVLEPYFYPENATDKSVSWYTSDWSVASVEKDSGRIYSSGVGEANVFGVTNDLSHKTVVCHIKVFPAITESLVIDPINWEGKKGDHFQILATVYPKEALGNIIWISSDEQIATVDKEGNVEVLEEGTCLIRAVAADGSDISAECLITSVSGVDGLISEKKLEIYSINGSILKKDANRKDLEQLNPGIYLIREGDKTNKIVIR